MKLLIQKVTFLSVFALLICINKPLLSMYYTGSSFSNADQAMAKYTKPSLEYAKPIMEYAKPVIHYGQYFGSGFASQAGLNQGLGIAKTTANLPALSQQQIAVLTATGSAFAVLPLMMTLSSAAGLGLASVIDTMKGTTEADIKDRIAQEMDARYQHSLTTPDKKLEFETKSFYDRWKARVSSQEAAKAAARGSLLTRGLVVGATAASLLGPKIIEYLSSEEQAENTPPAVPLTAEQEMLGRLKRIEAKLNSSPLESIMKITPEQVSFFAGQLAASRVPTNWGVKYLDKFNKWKAALLAK